MIASFSTLKITLETEFWLKSAGRNYQFSIMSLKHIWDHKNFLTKVLKFYFNFDIYLILGWILLKISTNALNTARN